MKLERYHIPRTLDETLALLDAETREGHEPFVLAGGTDLIVRTREGRMAPRVIVQIEALRDLARIEETETRLRLGARVSFAQILESPLVAKHAKILALASFEIGAPQIQSRGTVGGQLGTASPVGDLLPPLCVLEAEVVCRSVSGERRVPIRQWLRGVGVCDKRPNELILGVEFAKLEPTDHCVWFKLGPRRAQSISKVSLAGVVRLDGRRCVTLCRLALGAVAVTAVRPPKTEALVTGQVLTPDLIRRAVETVMTEVTPITDLRSTEAYRKKMCGVLVRRGLTQVLDAVVT
jgi:xanthine dehydrogenase FAD-binding subunit